MAVCGLGVCSWSLQPDSPGDLVSRLVSTGLSKVQLALSPVVSDRECWGDVIGVLEAAGFSIASGMMAPVGEDYSTLETIARTGGIRPDITWPANEAMARAMAVVARGAGIELVTLHAGFLPHDREDPERGRMVQRLQTLASIFSDQGIRVAFETGQETADTLVEVLNDIDRDSVGVNFDPANMVLYGMGDPVEALRILSPYVFQIHIKDAVPPETPGTWGQEVPVGTGTVDWSGFFKVLESNTLEVEAIIEREAGGSRVEDVLTAADLVRSHVGSGVK
ncbi:MAG: sugar phosphate isomerase/epimerase family protein [Planctomycetota bacterium]|nr:sugar phosphate isomerase/epimerase family protein [Planctomycetota bacterium]